MRRSQKLEARSKKTGRVGRLKAGLQTLHRDERGAISVLVLLTIWCLVAILGLVWNTTEESVKRQRIQTAADAAAHAASTWVSRTINAIDAQNMVISQDASEEVIWRAVPPTDQALMQELQRELALALQMKQQQNLPALLQRLRTQLGNVATERQLIMDAMTTLQAGSGANYADANEAARYANQYRQSISVREWVWSTYVQGQAPQTLDIRAPRRPLPPGPNGEGLAQIVAAIEANPPNRDAILDYIINFINTTEIPIVRAFEARTAPATRQPVGQIVAAHQAEVYQNELNMVENLAVTIEQQRVALADFYKTDLTLATLKRPADSAGPAMVGAPLMPASMAPPVTGYTDSIRTAFPVQALTAGLSPVLDIDAINVHTNGAIIWHPDVPVLVPAGVQAQYPTVKPSYQVQVNLRDPVNNRIIGWGENYAAPLEHYVHQRVNNDLQTLENDYMQPLDAARRTLHDTIQTMAGGFNINIQPLPNQLPDDQAEPNIPPLQPGDPIPPARFDQINVLPRLTAPLNSSAGFRAQVALYNQHGGAYTAAVRGLVTAILNFIAQFNQFTDAFAVETWETNVNRECISVLEALGSGKRFMVLSTYGLRAIPDWAKAGMYDNATAAIENQIVVLNIRKLARDILIDMKNQDPQGVGAGILDQAYRDSVTSARYSADAARLADQLLRPAAHDIALRIAQEWVNRPWPYEMTPPDRPVPPFRGIAPDERKREYSVIGAARQTDATAPKLLLTKFFGDDQNKLVAYGQGETFNWMEFNPAYGGGERFDEVVPISEVTYRVGNSRFNAFVGSPRGWRVDSLGGWNWRTRLSLADALYEALPLNGELREYSQDAGIENPSSGALDEINLH